MASLGATPEGRVTEVRTTWHDVIFCPCINRESVPESKARYAFLCPKDSGMAVSSRLRRLKDDRSNFKQ